MKSHFSALLAAAVTLWAPLVAAVTTSARYGGGCALLGSKIYCYGGGTFVNGQQRASTMDDFTFLETNRSFTVSEAGASWVSPNNSVAGIQPEPNFMFVMAAIPGSNKLIINGGLGDNNQQKAMKYPMVEYDADKNTWKSLSLDYLVQTQSHTAVMVNATTMIVWGGYSNIWTGFNGTIYPSVPHIWNVQSESFHDGPDITSVLHPRHQHAGVLGPDGKTIYYIGGIKENSNVVNNTVQYSDAAALMTDIITFDTSTLKWGLQNPTGTIPSTRRLHTLTLLPNSSKILMYGGVGISNSNAVEDVCYTLDLDDNTWQKITFSDNKGLGPRYGHSAVLVKNSLFILFGVNSQGATTSDFGIINTSNLSWVEQYGGLMSDDAAEYPVGARLSGGAIAGVVVGCVAGVAIICGLGAFCFIRRKRNGKYIQGHENKGDMEILEGSNSSASAPPRYDFNQHDKPDGSGARLTLEPVVKPDGA